jgi:hypothetical protein
VPFLTRVPDLWDSVIGQHIEVVRALTNSTPEDVFACLEEELKAVILAVRTESNWTLPVLFAVCLELKNAAVVADSKVKVFWFHHSIIMFFVIGQVGQERVHARSGPQTERRF